MRISVKDALKNGWIDPDQAPAQKNLVSKAKKGELEGEEQAQLIHQFRALYPAEGHLLIHIPNGGARKNAFEGWRLKQQGVRAGVSDLFLPIARGGYHGLWIEFKAAPPNDAQVSDSQKEWVALMQGQGYQALVCKGVAEAMQVLVSYMRAPATQTARVN